MEEELIEMTTNTEIMYWKKNKDWYEKDPQGQYIFRVKESAPERAKESFKLWEEHQNK